MEMVMCRSCGEFSTATMDEDKWVSRVDECPECGGTEFKHLYADSTVEADDDD